MVSRDCTPSTTSIGPRVIRFPSAVNSAPENFVWERGAPDLLEFYIDELDLPCRNEW